MKRCQYLMSNDPYVSFNFERSLRKYEPSPRKKVKIDDCGGFKEKINVVDKSNSKRESLQQQENLVQEVNCHKANDEPQINLTEYKNESRLVQNADESNIREIFNQNKQEAVRIEEKYNNDKCKEMESQNVNSIAQILKNQQLNICEQKNDEIIENSLEPDQPEIVQESKEIKQQNILAVLEEHLKMSQPQLISHQADSEFSIGQNQNNSMQSTFTDSTKTKIEGGRFNINNQISISMRTLQKFLYKNHKKQQNESIMDLLEYILKKRSYLISERQQIAKKLEQYLKNI